MFWFIGIGVLIILLYFYMVKPFQYWKRLGVEQNSIFSLYFELLTVFIPYRSAFDAIQKIYNDYPDKRYNGGYQFGQPSLLLRDPELIKQLTIKDFEFFTDHFVPFTDAGDNILVKSVIALKGQKWKNMRMILSPSFTSSKLKTIFHLIGDSAKQLINHFDNMEDKVISVEVKGMFTKLTNDVIATSAFGISFNSFENPSNDFYVMAKEITNFGSILRNLNLMFLMTFPKIAEILGLKFFKVKLTNFFENLITQNIQIREKQGIVRPDMIQLLLEAKRKTGEYEEIIEEENEIYAVIKDKENKIKKVQLTDDDIMSQAFLFFFAGFEVIAVILSFIAHELALNPDIQERLYKEIEENIRNFGKDPSYENLMKMKYLDMVISETLRKYPPSPIADRICTKPYTLQPTSEDEIPINFKVGNLISIPIYGLHRDPKYFPNPERFDPERFNDENKPNILPGTYIPFGIGPRHCMGNRFALLEVKTAIYYILSKFKIVVIDKTQIPIKLSKSQFSLNSEKGFWLGLEKRVNNN